MSCAACAAYGDTALSQRSSRFIVRTCPLLSVSVRTTAQFHEAPPQSASRPPVLSPPAATPIGFVGALQSLLSPYFSVPLRTTVSLHEALCIAPAAHRSYSRPPPLPSALSQRSSRFIVRTCPLMSVSVRTPVSLHVALCIAPAASRRAGARQARGSG